MKKVLLLCFAFVNIYWLNAQTDIDALRYSTTQNWGTARNIGTGGIFGTIGGDMSCMSSNPAGLARFTSNEFTISPAFIFGNNNVDYFNNKTSDNKFNVGLAGFGAVISPSKLEGKASFGIALNKQANFNESIFISGYNNRNSILESYADKIQGFDVNAAESNYPFDASLAFLSELITVDTPTGLNYTSVVKNGNIEQQMTIERKGGIDELAISGSGRINDKLYVGATFGLPLVNYTENYLYREIDINDSTALFNSFTQENYLNTDGIGFNLKMGFLAIPHKNIRLSVAFHTPTLLRLSDSYINILNSDFTTFTFDAESPEGAFDYKVVTPWKLQTGASFVHPNFGLIGIEYELSNPSKAKFKFDDNDPSSKILEADLNQNIAQKYDWSQTIKVGLESKWKNMRFRAGMQAQSSPFSDVFKPKTDKNFNFLYSGGLGYKGKKFSIDAAYARGKQTSTFVPYSRNSDTPIAAIESIQQNITISVGYKF
ncbi:MAG: hypothetical protein IPN09_01150 [Bacteroidetes bacterium]|nr:hypothetical protein [Bacteroidota bacterium]